MLIMLIILIVEFDFLFKKFNDFDRNARMCKFTIENSKAAFFVFDDKIEAVLIVFISNDSDDFLWCSSRFQFLHNFAPLRNNVLFYEVIDVITIKVCRQFNYTTNSRSFSLFSVFRVSDLRFFLAFFILILSSYSSTISMGIFFSGSQEFSL